MLLRQKVACVSVEKKESWYGSDIAVPQQWKWLYVEQATSTATDAYPVIRTRWSYSLNFEPVLIRIWLCRPHQNVLLQLMSFVVFENHWAFYVNWYIQMKQMRIHSFINLYWHLSTIHSSNWIDGHTASTMVSHLCNSPIRPWLNTLLQVFAKLVRSSSFYENWPAVVSKANALPRT